MRLYPVVNYMKAILILEENCFMTAQKSLINSSLRFGSRQRALILVIDFIASTVNSLTEQVRKDIIS